LTKEEKEINRLLSISNLYLIPDEIPQDKPYTFRGVILKPTPVSKKIWAEVYNRAQYRNNKSNDLTLGLICEQAMETIQKTTSKLDQEKLISLCILLFNHLKKIRSGKAIIYPVTFKGAFINICNETETKVEKFVLEMFSDNQMLFYKRKDKKAEGYHKAFYPALSIPTFTPIGRLEASNPDRIEDRTCSNINEINNILELDKINFKGMPKIERISVSPSIENPEEAIYYTEQFQGDICYFFEYFKEFNVEIPLAICFNFSHQLLQIMYSLKNLQKVHGDIKPENVFFKDFIIQLKQDGALEFKPGLKPAICLGDWENMATEGTLQNKIGTLNYLAPELFWDLGSDYLSSSKQDIWAVGCVIWILFFKGQTYPSSRIFAIIATNDDLYKHKDKITELLTKFHLFLGQYPGAVAKFFYGIFSPEPENRLEAIELNQLLHNIGTLSPDEVFKQIEEIDAQFDKFSDEAETLLEIETV